LGAVAAVQKRVTTHTYQQFESIIPVHPRIPPRRPLESYRIQLYDSQMAETRISMNDECNTSWKKTKTIQLNHHLHRNTLTLGAFVVINGSSFN
jgi:hypothetical protein